jgi:monoamine oxidase
MKTPLFSALRRAFRLAQLADPKHGKSFDDLLEGWSRPSETRRRFLKTSAQAGALIGVGGMGSAGVLLDALDGRPKYKIAVIGAGLAGLTAAWYLRKKRVEVTLFEGDKRPAGRMNSKRVFDGGKLITEFGAEFIDSNHDDMFRLIKDMGLGGWIMDIETDNFGLKEAFYIDNKPRTVKEIAEELNRINPVMDKDQKKVGTPRAQEFDRMSIAQYLETMPVSPWVRKLIDAAFVGENGRECSEQSALNFIDFIEPIQDHFKPFGESDERFKIIGGNDQLPKRLAERLKDQIRYEHRLIAFKELNNGDFLLTFSQNGTTQEGVFDAVIMTLPFTVLRDIEIKMELPPLKRRMIDELGYGTNSKFILETKTRAWRDAGFQGFLFNEQVSNGWDSSQLQQNNLGVGAYTCYFGGKQGLNARKGTETEQLAHVMPALEGIFPGTKAALTNNMELVNWTSNPFAKCSYTSYGVGQHTLFGGEAIKPVRNLYFAGEHCSDDYWGFMNGAAETGRRVAQSVLERIRSGGR